MLIRLICALSIVTTLILGDALPCRAQAPDSVGVPDALSALFSSLDQAIRARDSLTSLAHGKSGPPRELLEELIWQRHVEINQGVLAVADKLEEEERKGGDLTEVRRVLTEAVRDNWPGYRAQLERQRRSLATVSHSRDAATGAERLAIESDISQRSDRLLEAYRSLVDAILALEHVRIDVTEPRAFVVDGLRGATAGLVTSVQLTKRNLDGAASRLAREASNTDLRYSFEAAEERFKRATQTLSTAIEIMDRIGLESTDLSVSLIVATGKITTDVFRGRVFLGLLGQLWGRMLEFLAGKAPHWLFQGLLIVLTFAGFRALSKVLKRGVRSAVARSQFSELMRSTIVRLSSHAVMLVGFIVILTQLGVQVAPLLAGLGIAGFVVGFAMQNTLSNFAAGAMILGNQPFDIGDEIEVAGVSGIVRRMSLVSTTILTPDNQTLIIPNSTVWGGVIRNRTAQPNRRVDLTFSIGYADDVERAERVLREIVAGHERVLQEPAPVVKLNQLADSSVNFVVRAWTAKEQYWDVYWDLTRAAKLRFDQEGITIPFPQREVHVNLGRGTGDVVGVQGRVPRDS